MDVKSNYRRFEDEINKRGIDSLIHFTPTINLLSIYERGYIYSRQKLKEINEFNPELAIEDYVDYMDAIRLDKLTDYINMSIQFPNYFLLNAFRGRHNFAHYQWCVIKLTPDYIYEEGTMFSVCNAASRAAANYGIDGSIEKFLQLFSNQLDISGQLRTRANLQDKFPTEVQAEVLVKIPIPISHIIEVVFENEDILNSNISAFNISGFDTSKFIVNPQLFGNQRV